MTAEKRRKLWPLPVTVHDRREQGRAVVAQQVARLPFQAGGGGSSPTPRLHFTPCTAAESALLLASSHYLGPIGAARYGFAGWVDDVVECWCRTGIVMVPQAEVMACRTLSCGRPGCEEAA